MISFWDKIGNDQAVIIIKFIKNEDLHTMAYFSPIQITSKHIMISIDDFKIASFEKKCELVSTQTTYVTSRTDEEKKAYLYHTGRFFIEVVYSPPLKRVMLIKAFNDHSSLLPYVETVSLEDLRL